MEDHFATALNTTSVDCLLSPRYSIAQSVFQKCGRTGKLEASKAIIDFYMHQNLLSEFLTQVVSTETSSCANIEDWARWLRHHDSSLFLTFIRRIGLLESNKLVLNLIWRPVFAPMKNATGRIPSADLAKIVHDCIRVVLENAVIFPTETKQAIAIARSAIGARQDSVTDQIVSALVIRYVLIPHITTYLEADSGDEERKENLKSNLRRFLKLLKAVVDNDPKNRLQVEDFWENIMLNLINATKAFATTVSSPKFARKSESNEKKAQDLFEKIMEFRKHATTSPELDAATLHSERRVETPTGSPFSHHFNEPNLHPQRARFGSDPKKKPRVLPLNFTALHLHKARTDDDSDEDDSSRFKGVLYSPSSNSSQSARDTDSPRPFSSARQRSPMSTTDLSSISPTIPSSRSPSGESRVPLVTMLRSVHSRDSTQSSSSTN